MSGKIVFILAILAFLNLGCRTNSYSKSNQYVITYDQNRVSERWAFYLLYHLEKRMMEHNVSMDENKTGTQIIHVSVDPDNSHDYCIKQKNKTIFLISKQERTMLWLIYQLISNLSQSDKNIDADDIPPAIIPLESTCRNFDFSYREPYFLPNLQFEYAPLIGADMVETSWGLWGHGMEKVVKDTKSDSLYAFRDGKIDKSQFCFSSTDLCYLVKYYILDNYGDGEEHSTNFMIMPNDNNVVCTCPQCIAAGNTKNNATPALTNFITKLADCFPAHNFFTTAYLTVKAPTEPYAISNAKASLKNRWPENTGVMISTINLPKGVPLKPSANRTRFEELINAWKQKVANIYIWDYAANFDDWMTPLPILYALQNQLRYFKKQGVTGIFLNGSGYDYSPFDDVKTYVSAALMMNVNASVDTLCKQYLNHFYPVSGKLLSDYYLSLEKQAWQAGKPYNIYGNLGNSAIFTDIDGFVDFYDALEAYISKSSGIEKHMLVKLQTALSFSRLQLALYLGTGKYGVAELNDYTMVTRPEAKLFIERLKRFESFEDMKNYKEANGLLADFLADVEKRLDNPVRNLLIGVPLEVLTELDDDYRDIRIIQNGILGYVNNYHYGWLIVSADSFRLQLNTTEDIRKGKKMYLRFLNNQRHNIFPPEKTVIYKDGKIYAELFSKEDENICVVQLETDLNLADAESLVIEMTKRKGTKVTMAFDEIIIN